MFAFHFGNNNVVFCVSLFALLPEPDLMLNRKIYILIYMFTILDFLFFLNPGFYSITHLFNNYL